MARRTYLSSLAVLFLVLMLASLASVSAELAGGSKRVLLVSGVVRDAGTLRTVMGADVRLSFLGVDVASTHTNGGGRYRLRYEVPAAGLPSGSYEVHARDGRYCGSLPTGRFELNGIERTAMLTFDLLLQPCGDVD